MRRDVSGFTPTREDGEETPREPRTLTNNTNSNHRHFGADPISVLQRRLSVVDLSPARVNRQAEHDSDGSDEDEGPANDGFDEDQFTDEYFQAWEGDIDSDDEWAYHYDTDVVGPEPTYLMQGRFV